MNSQNEAGESPTSFTGAQGQSGKTECVLIYDPATGTFTLEKLLSTFTLNLTSPSLNLHQPLTLPSDSDEPDNGSSEGDIAKADKENPFDYRHFINNKFEVQTASSRTHGKTQQPEGLESLSDRDASGEDDVDILQRQPLPSAPLRQSLPARPRTTSASKPKPKSNQRATVASKKSNTNASISVAARRRGATPTESIDLTPTPHPQTGDKRPRMEESSSESDVDDGSEESEEDEETELFAGSGELIIEGEDVDERNNSSRSTTAGIGSSWAKANRGGPISLSATAGDVDMTTGDAESASDEEEETTPVMNGAGMPSPYNAPMSLSGHGGGHRTVVEDDTSSDEDEDEEPQHLYHQQQQQHVPTPNGVDEYEEEEEEEGEYDLENMMEELLEEQEENSVPVDTKPISLGGVRDDEESSSEEE